MKQVTMLWLSILSICVGLIYFAIQKQVIIVRVPSYASTDVAREGQVQSKRNIMISYWSQGAFKQEPITIIDAGNQEDTVRYIVTSWLTLVEQTAVLNKHVSVESAMLSSSHDAYISFDHSIFTKDESIHEKWMRIESLLHTLSAAHMGINRVHILEHHRPLVDTHLDFSKAWPINGFSGL